MIDAENRTEIAAREEMWRKFPMIHRSATLHNIARMHIGGQLRYVTALLTAIDILSERAREQIAKGWRKESLVVIPTDADIESALLGAAHQDLNQLEFMVSKPVWADEESIAEYARQIHASAFSSLTQEDLKKMRIL